LNWQPCAESYNLNQAVLTEIPFRYCLTIGCTDNGFLVPGTQRAVTPAIMQGIYTGRKISTHHINQFLPEISFFASVVFLV